MADLTITVADVADGTGASFIRGEAGELLTAGVPVYRNASDGLFYNTDADSTEAAAACVGIAITSAAAGQPVTVQTGGNLDLGATLTVGTIYVVSDTVSKIKPTADLASGDYVTILGVADAADNLVMGLLASGAQIA